MSVTTPTLEELKELFSIDDAYRLLGLEGESKKSRRCPNHDDRNPSFSIFDHGKRFKCFGCGIQGDGVDLVAVMKGISVAEARQEVLRWLGHREPVRQEQPHQTLRPAKIEFPPADKWDREIAQRVADSRGLRITSVEFAALWLGTLTFGQVCDYPSWILSDATHKCAEARRIDGNPFPAIGTLAERKAHTLAGSRKNWPLGLLPPAFEEPWLKEHVHRILLMEGGPDYLAACQIIAAQDVNILPVAMLGASQRIAFGALPYFAERETVIVAHPDEAGREAGIRWAQQIKGAGGQVEVVQGDNDLNDAVSAGGITNALELF